MSTTYSPRELAYAGLFGAAALLLPFLFHLVRLGSVFMPMYLPLVALAFLVRPLPAAVTAAVTPLLSAVVTGMPPFYPPVAVFMAVELAVMAAIIAAARRSWPRASVWLILVPALLLGRVLYVAMYYFFSRAAALPAPFLATVSFVRGWPGIALMLVVVPAVVRIVERRGRPRHLVAGGEAGQ